MPFQSHHRVSLVPSSAIAMTRFVYDQFAKSCFEPLLSVIGNFRPALEIPAEVREIDIYFEPFPNAIPPADLGLLQQCISTPSMATIFEPFRNAAAPYQIRSCASKLYELHNDIARKAKNPGQGQKKKRLPLPDTWPFLWIVTPTLSKAVLEEFGAVLWPGWPPGVYFADKGWKTGFIVVHHLPTTPDTLWFRLLGRNKVQAQAFTEVQQLPSEHPFRRPLIESLANLHVMLEARKPRQPFEQNLLMQLSPLYLEKVAAAEQEGRIQERQEMVLDLLSDKFRSLPTVLQVQVKSLSLEQLRTLGKSLQGFSSIDDLNNWLAGQQ